MKRESITVLLLAGLAVLGVHGVLAGGGRKSVNCATATYGCPNDTHTYTANCNPGGNAADGDSTDNGWAWELAEASVCGTYKAEKCAGSPERACQPDTKAYPTTKMPE
jgi:hypothetical protein